MAKKLKEGNPPKPPAAGRLPSARPSSLLDTRVIYCGDNFEQLAKPALSLSTGLPDRCIDLTYIDPPFNSNRNYEVFWGETKEKRSFEDRNASAPAYIGIPLTGQAMTHWIPSPP